MITLRRAVATAPTQRSARSPTRAHPPRPRQDQLRDELGTVHAYRVAPGQDVPRHPRPDAELVTYVRAGALSYEDSRGCRGMVQAGEFSRLTGGQDLRCSETNASQTEWAHLFQVWLGIASPGLEPGREKKRFSAAQRRGRLCVVASPDGRDGSLRIHHHALLYSAILDRGQHAIHELADGRVASVHMVHGEIGIADVVLGTGDSVSVTAQRAVSFTAREDCEVLLVNLDSPRRAAGPEDTGQHRDGNHTT